MSKVRILSLDGGGIRGIIPGTILRVLEEMLQKQTGNSNARIADFFDLIVGTSTGGILSCALLVPGADGRPRYTAQKAVDIYLERGNEIFDRNLKQIVMSGNAILDEKYSDKNLVKVLKEYFGELRYKELVKPALITAYNIDTEHGSDVGQPSKSSEGFFMASRDALNNPEYDFPVWQVARATSAAPTYFEAALITSATGRQYPLVDGGVFVNNPALCGYAEARTMEFPDRGISYPSAKDMIIVSIGTGSQKKRNPYNKAKDYGKLEWAVPVIDIMMSGAAQVVDYQLRKMYNTLEENRDGYFRLNLNLADYANVDPEMDNASKKNMSALKAAAEHFAQQNNDILDKIVGKLTTSIVNNPVAV